MKKYSYPYLFTLAIGVLAAIFGFIVWRNAVYRTTFLSHSVFKYTLNAALATTVFVCFALRKRFAANISKRTDYLKAYGGIAVMMILIFIALLTTVTWLLPGVESAYIAPYKYSAGDSRNCRAAKVYDRDLNEEIRICEPSGHFPSGNTIRVIKRTNALGMVVVDAATGP